MTTTVPPDVALAGASLSTDERAPLLIDQTSLLAADSDPSNDGFTISGVDALSASGASVVMNGDVILYNPGDVFGDLAQGAVATDTFSYTIDDGAGGSSIATATISIVGVNDGPVITPQSAPFALAEGDDDLLIFLESFALDAEDDPILYEIASLTIDVDGADIPVAVDDILGVGFNFDGETNEALIQPNGLADTFGLGAGEVMTLTVAFDLTDVAVTGRRGEQTLTLSATITGVDDAPVPADDAAAIDEDVALTDGQLTATEADGDTLTFAIAASGDPAHGAVTINGDGTYTYTPDQDYSGDDSFTFQVTDEDANVETATVSITIREVNDDPVGAAIGTSGFEDQANEIDGVLSATDVEGDSVTFALAADGAPANGAATVSEAGFYSYTPDANFFGTDSFTYQITDDRGGVGVATVTIDITATPDDPVGATTALSVDEDATLTAQLQATDPDGQTAFTFALSSGAANGSVSVSAAGAVTYTPDADFNGQDGFSYSVQDEDGRSSTTSVTVAVAAVNDAPTIADISLTGDEDTAITAALSGTDLDGDALTYTVATGGGPSHGALTIQTGGALTYTPDADFNGVDSFSYVVSDGAATATATATVTIAAVNDAPRDATTSITGAEDSVIAGQLTATDAEGGALTFRLASGGAPAKGGLTLGADGAYAYTPDADFTGDDRLTYVITDAEGAETTATATITVEGVNDAPVADDASIEVTGGARATGQLIAADVDGDALSFSLDPAGGPAAGAVVIDGDGGFVYTPAGLMGGTDSFRFLVDDGAADPVSGAVQVTILAASAGTDGGDAFVGAAGADLFDGGGGADTISGGAGNDTISGGGGGDSLSGGAGRDQLSGGGGKDHLSGGGGKDALAGNGGKDTLEGGGGKDQLSGGGGNDRLHAGGGKDRLDGGGGRDVMQGGGGSDEILGGRGADTLTGGGGRDRFIFDRGDGRDVITDFQQGRDKIVVDGGASGFDDLQISQIGADVRIKIGGTLVTVLDDAASHFTASDFIF